MQELFRKDQQAAADREAGGGSGVSTEHLDGLLVALEKVQELSESQATEQTSLKGRMTNVEHRMDGTARKQDVVDSLVLDVGRLQDDITSNQNHSARLTERLFDLERLCAETRAIGQPEDDHALRNRVASIERVLEESSGKYLKWDAGLESVETLWQRLDNVNSHIIAFADRLDIEGLGQLLLASADKDAKWEATQRSSEKLQEELDGVGAHIVTFAERVDGVVMAMADKKLRLDELEAKVERSIESGVRCDKPRDGASDSRQANSQQNEALLLRLNYLEGLLGDATGDHESLEARLLATETLYSTFEEQVQSMTAHVSALQRANAGARLAAMKKLPQPSQPEALTNRPVPKQASPAPP
jgi:chromosome segregation ATPase